MSPAPWRVIQERLIANGDMTEQNVTRSPKARHCRHCGRAVIAAITDTGFEIAVEPTPTTPAGELDVLIHGRHTFALLDHGEMVRRDQHRIAHADANKERAHAQHQCDQAPPEMNALFAAPKKARIEHSDVIPF